MNLDNKIEALEALKTSNSSLKYISEHLWNDADVMEIAVKNDPKVFNMLLQACKLIPKL